MWHSRSFLVMFIGLHSFMVCAREHRINCIKTLALDLTEVVYDLKMIEATLFHAIVKTCFVLHFFSSFFFFFASFNLVELMIWLSSHNKTPFYCRAHASFTKMILFSSFFFDTNRIICSTQFKSTYIYIWKKIWDVLCYADTIMK